MENELEGRDRVEVHRVQSREPEDERRHVGGVPSQVENARAPERDVARVAGGRVRKQRRVGSPGHAVAKLVLADRQRIAGRRKEQRCRSQEPEARSQDLGNRHSTFGNRESLHAGCVAWAKRWRMCSTSLSSAAVAAERSAFMMARGEERPCPTTTVPSTPSSNAPPCSW